MNILIFLLTKIIAASVPDWLIPALNPGCVVITTFDFELSVTSVGGDSVGDQVGGGNHGNRPGDENQDNNQPDYTKKCERMRLKNEIEAKSDFQITEMRFEKEKQKLIGKIIKAKGSNHYKNPIFPAEEIFEFSIPVVIPEFYQVLKGIPRLFVVELNLVSVKHSVESFGAVSAAARSNITSTFDEVGYSDNWISFGLSKCLKCSDFPCSHVCNRYTADYNVCECPPCWELGRDMMTCVPKTENYSLTCSSGMKVTLDSCVLGAASKNGNAVIMSQNGDCRADYNASGTRF